MAYNKTSQKFNASIRELTIGSGDKTVVLGGENVLPFYTFDAEIKNAPKIGVEISDLGMADNVSGIAEYYAGAETLVDIAKKAAAMPGADFVVLTFDAADPNGEDRSAEECAAEAKAVAEAIDLPLAIQGCKNMEKNTKVFEKVAEALADTKTVFISAKEENYKTVAASAGLAFGHAINAESADDINLAKQLNVLIGQMGIKPENIAMNVGTAAAGYGFEYVVSTMERIKMAALSQNDDMLQMPIISPISGEALGVKEAVVSEEDFPEWGPTDERAIDMEIETASACLASGTDAVILRHPVSVATISKMIKALM